MERSVANWSSGRSVSVSSLSSSLDTSAGMEVEDLDLMDCLVADVGLLSESLQRLSAAVSGTPPPSVAGEAETGNQCVWVHEGLRNTSSKLRDLLERYHFLRCSDILSPASNLVHAIKGLKFDVAVSEQGEEGSYQRALQSIQKLQAALAERVGDYLTWEMSHYDYLRPQSSEDAGDLSSRKESAMSVPEFRRGRVIARRHSAYLSKPTKEYLSTEEMDGILARLGNGLELAFDRCKGWSRYCKELLSSVNRRIAMELDHAKAVHRLAESAATALQDDHFMPLHSIYLKSFKVEADFFHNSSETMKKLYDYKFIKPLETRKAEHDRKRKELKGQWDRALRAANESQAELRKARDVLSSRDVAYRKARDASVLEETAPATTPDPRKVDKCRQRETELLRKKTSADSEVHRLQRDLADKLTKLEAKKTHILSELRELIYQCDQTTKACTVAYFQALSGLWSLLPMQYQSLSDAARQYTPGMEYMQYVQNLPSSVPNPPALVHGPPWTPQPGRAGMEGRGETEFRESELSLPGASEGPAATHTLLKNRVPQRCAHCDALSFFLTFTCSKCHQSWHRACLSQLKTGCGEAESGSEWGKAGGSTIFGVPLPTHLASTNRDIPIVVQRCVEELDKRGRVKGLYRVCGTKSKIDWTCGAIEAGGGEGPYADTSPSVLASVLKLYLRQLPQSLLTDALYTPALALAKEFPPERELKPGEAEEMLTRLRALLLRLPPPNARTLRYLVLHLKRMTWFESETSMNAMNLGIVFGPTLMGREEDAGADSLQPLLQLPSQTRLIELIITHAYELFDVSEEDEVREFCERTGLAIESIPRGRGRKEEGLRRGSSLSSLSIATTPDPHSPHSTSDDYDLDPTLPNTLRGIPATTTLSISSTNSSQRSPVTSEDSGNKTSSETAGSPNAGRQKSATPDLLKGRHRPPFSSPSSSQDNDHTLHDNSTSDEDPATFTPITNSPVVQPSRGRQTERLETTEEQAEEGGESTPRRKPRFERARPIRRNSRPRNYTTSIFVSPSKLDAEGRRRSSEDVSSVGVTARVAASVALPHSRSSPLSLPLADQPSPLAAITAQGDSVHILLSANPDDLSYV